MEQRVTRTTLRADGKSENRRVPPSRIPRCAGTRDRIRYRASHRAFEGVHTALLILERENLDTRYRPDPDNARVNGARIGKICGQAPRSIAGHLSLTAVSVKNQCGNIRGAVANRRLKEYDTVGADACLSPAQSPGQRAKGLAGAAFHRLDNEKVVSEPVQLWPTSWSKDRSLDVP